jgi:hypothetical protein
MPAVSADMVRRVCSTGVISLCGDRWSGGGAGDAEVLTWRVVGWRSSAEKVDEVAGMLASGLLPIVD